MTQWLKSNALNIDAGHDFIEFIKNIKVLNNLNLDQIDFIDSQILSKLGYKIETTAPEIELGESEEEKYDPSPISQELM
jgi:hypothetical protein